MKRQRNKLEKTIIKIEEDLERLETEKTTLHNKIEVGGADFYFDKEFKEITDKLQKIEKKIDENTVKWEKAGIKLEELPDEV